MTSRDKTPCEIADLIERFVSDRRAHFREWNEFVEGRLQDPRLDAIRKQCGRIGDQFGSSYRDTLDLSRDDRWQDAVRQLSEIAEQLRDSAKQSKK